MKSHSLKTGCEKAAEEIFRIAKKRSTSVLDCKETSTLLLEACLFRRESRGGHFRGDAPTPLPHWRHHSRQVRGKRIHTRRVVE